MAKYVARFEITTGVGVSDRYFRFVAEDDIRAKESVRKEQDRIFSNEFHGVASVEARELYKQITLRE